MIERRHIIDWRAKAPWTQDAHVEQDLVICRAVVEIFSDPFLREAVAFRGGTALHKLHLNAPARYSEDIDLVQIRAERAGPMMGALRDALQPWLGKPRWRLKEGRVVLYFRYPSEASPERPLRLKVEINSREHFAVHGFTRVPFRVSSGWFDGGCDVTSYTLEELLATKLRALYQRRKPRDLFDLSVALEGADVDPGRVVSAFLEYMDFEGRKITRAQFEENLEAKMRDGGFGLGELDAFLADGHEWDPGRAAERVRATLIERLPGEAWQGDGAERT